MTERTLESDERWAWEKYQEAIQKGDLAGIEHFGSVWERFQRALNVEREAIRKAEEQTR